jgi:hypothetical protein
LVYGTDITGYAPSTYDAATSNALPYIPGYVSADYPKIIWASDYAIVSNLKAGKGDPCMLVGYTGAQLAAMDDTQLQSVLDNAAYRTPTSAENQEFAGTNSSKATTIHWTEGNPDDRAGNPGIGKLPLVDNTLGDAFSFTLPAGGYRASGAVVLDQGYGGWYWSSTPGDTNSYYLRVNKSYVHPNSDGRYSFGFNVRCVPNN